MWGGGGGPSRPVPFFPLRRKILAQRGSLLVSVYMVLVVLATCFCWPTYPSLSWAVLLGGSHICDLQQSTSNVHPFEAGMHLQIRVHLDSGCTQIYTTCNPLGPAKIALRRGGGASKPLFWTTIPPKIAV